MSMQKFFAIPERTKVNLRLVLPMVILAFVTIVGLFIYDRYWSERKVAPALRQESSVSTLEGKVEAAAIIEEED